MFTIRMLTFATNFIRYQIRTGKSHLTKTSGIAHLFVRYSRKILKWAISNYLSMYWNAMFYYFVAWNVSYENNVFGNEENNNFCKTEFLIN